MKSALRTTAVLLPLGLVALLATARADDPAPLSPGSDVGVAAVSSLASDAPVAGVAYDLVLWNGSPYIDLTIDGASGRFLFDTGANVSGVDQGWLAGSRLAWSPGASSTLAGTTGVLAAPTAVLGRFDLGHGFFASPTFLVESFAGFGMPGDRGQAGLLGMDFIRCYATTLDLGRGRAVLALASERAAPALDESSVDLTLPRNLPTVTARVGGLDVPCRLDTGAAYLDARPLLDVNRALVDALAASGTFLTQTGTLVVAGVSGQEVLPLYEATDLAIEIGPVRVPGAVLVVHDQGSLADPTPLALAGVPVLSRLGAFRLDPFDGKLWLRAPDAR